MGQRKTWSLHHVPFSMLWETMAIDHKNNWNTVLDSLTSTRFLEAANDRQYKNSFFAFTWKSRYFSSVYRKVNLKTGENTTPRTKRISFSWIRNANKGSNETSCGKSHFVCFNSEVFLLNLFFRQKILFEDKKEEDGIDESVLVGKTHITSCFAIKKFIDETVEKTYIFAKNRRKKRSNRRVRKTKSLKITKLLKILPKFTRIRVKGFVKFIPVKRKTIRNRRRLKRLVRGIHYGVKIIKKDPKFWSKSLKKALVNNFKIPAVFYLL